MLYSIAYKGKAITPAIPLYQAYRQLERLRESFQNIELIRVEDQTNELEGSEYGREIEIG